jgi:hypothetical protein
LIIKDLTAGLAQPIKYAARLITGKTKTAADEIKVIPRGLTLLQFLKSKESPIIGLTSKLLTQKDFLGQPVGTPPQSKIGEFLTEQGVPKWAQVLGKQIGEEGTFLWTQDLVDAFNYGGLLDAAVTLPFVWYGEGFMAYPEQSSTTLTKTQNELAQKTYGKNWDELTNEQFKKLEQSPELEILKRQVTEQKTTGAPPRYEEERINAGLKVQNSLKSETQKVLKEYNISVGQIPRSIGGWELNDEKYIRYQELIKQEIENAISNPNGQYWIQSHKSNWPSKSQNDKAKVIETYVIEQARSKALNKLKWEK